MPSADSWLRRNAALGQLQGLWRGGMPQGPVSPSLFSVLWWFMGQGQGWTGIGGQVGLAGDGVRETKSWGTRPVC